MDTVRRVYDLLKDHVPLCLVQCTSAYPFADDQANLRVMDTFRQEFPEAHIGYSGHEMGWIPTLAAVARGARVCLASLQNNVYDNQQWVYIVC